MARRAGRPTLYPWDEWLDGEEHTIVKDVDFDRGVESMRSHILAVGQKKGLEVTTSHTRDKPDEIRFKVVGPA